jgi:hypothetical protein
MLCFMKKILSLLVFSLLTVFLLFVQSQGALAQQQGNTLTGSVKDSATGKSLPGISVFLNSTSKGTVTRADGTFVLPGIPPGRYQMVVSAIGYETVVIEISSRSLPPPLKIALRVKASELEAVTVEPYLKDGWQRYGKFFLDNFIGTTDNASSCSIKNKNVLRFHFYPKSKRLSVTATDPLIIENKALGYDLEYRLERFVCDYSTNIVSYYGYPLFREMTADFPSIQSKWEARRQLAYMGSLMHFMRTLYKDQLRQEGFIVEHEINVPNLEKQRVKAIYQPNISKTDSIPIDTLHHYWEVLRQPDFFIQKVRSYDGLLTIHPDQTRTLFFTGDCTIIFGNGHLGIAYQQSELRLMEQVPIEIGENGSYYPSQEVLTLGNWSKTETIANLLPRDFEMYTPAAK